MKVEGLVIAGDLGNASRPQEGVFFIFYKTSTQVEITFETKAS